jgi:hypothetical protein
MKNSRSQFWWAAACSVVFGNAIMLSAAAAPRSIYLWNSAVGSSGLASNMNSARVGTWGNGQYQETRKMQYEGAPTLKITTRNLREGVRFDLKTPLDIEPYRDSGYLRLRLHFDDAAAAVPIAGSGTVPGAPGIPGVPTVPGQPAVPGGFGGYGAAPQMRANFQMGPLPSLGSMGGLPDGLGTGQGALPSGPPPQETKLTQLLCTLVLDQGVMESTLVIPKQWDNQKQIDYDKLHPDANGWLMLVLPIKQMRATPDASGLVQRIILTGDQEDTFYLTQLALVVESGEMSVSIRRPSDAPGAQLGEITIKPGPLTLVAEVEAGAADLIVEWNFDADNVGNLPPPNPYGDQPTRPAGGAPGLPTLPDAITPDGAVAPVPGANEGNAVAIGPRIDARGLIAKFEYPNEEQNYRVEVTVRDRSGKKEPVKASLLVKIRG